MAYYISLINIEDTYSKLTNEYLSFNHAILTDTFQLLEKRSNENISLFENDNLFQEVHNKAKEENQADIKIIIGNPIQHIQQKNKIPKSWSKYFDNYVDDPKYLKNNSKYSKSFHNSCIRAFRWASDRLGEKGIIAFVTNDNFIENPHFGKFRDSLKKEFNQVFVYRKSKSKEDNITIVFLVKNNIKNNEPFINYYQIAENLNKEKLNEFNENQSFYDLEFQKIIPDYKKNWLNQIDLNSIKFINLGSPKKGNINNLQNIFNKNFSLGITTSKNGWVYSFDEQSLKEKMIEYINEFNKLIDLLQNDLEFQSIENDLEYKKRMNYIQEKYKPKIKISKFQIKRTLKKRKLKYTKNDVCVCQYKPFVKRYCYFNEKILEFIYLWPKIFPSNNTKNKLISIPDSPKKVGFSCLAGNEIRDFNFLKSGSQSFPFYWYEDKIDDKKVNIDLEIVELFQKKYNNDLKINEDDIYAYIYAIFHSKIYQRKYCKNLIKELPKIPFLNRFWKYVDIGKKLMSLHIDYEKVDAYQGVKIKIIKEDYTVKELSFSNNNKSIIFNEYITIDNIPLKTYKYKISGKSPLEWVVDQYQYSVDKNSGIINDPNKFDKIKGGKYVFDLILSLITLSLETLDLIDQLPEYQEI
ncbi:Type ISP restriction-modification enzyme, C-terminal specificity domain-containing protein [[Mycoplasma] cavipharyngis]|uniref:type ISP restriction/modification enzyme n=1 Tax=[Mycoplasma] cavipharyngis TaxID=92757 RepID=UPI0037048A12